jgi:hypothetical protein
MNMRSLESALLAGFIPPPAMNPFHSFVAQGVPLAWGSNEAQGSTIISRLLKKYEILSSSFDRLRMRSRVFDGLALMVSLSNHGQHRFSAAC